MAADLFTPLPVRGVELPNRIAVSPMCQHSTAGDGLATDWHLVHLGSRAVGGAGLVSTEATAVEPRGRISPGDLGLWSDEHADALRPVVEFVRERGSVPGIQLAHSGRKGSTQRPWNGGAPIQPDDGGWETLAPSEVPYPYEGADAPPIRAATRSDLDAVVAAFGDAAARAADVGFRVLEVHAAHGYLLHEFLSPVTNHRDDEYGGSFENRTRLLREVVVATRENWPDENPLFVRISATDWLPDRVSWDVEQSARLVDDLATLGVDLVDVSAGGIHPDQQIPSPGPSYQLPLAETIRATIDTDVRLASVGGITEPIQADEIVRNGRADLVVIGREHLRDPYFTLHAAAALGQSDRVDNPVQYDRAF